MFIRIIFHCFISGTYLYIETSSPRKQGDNAVIQSQEIPINPQYCFSFWYFMHGSSVGSLNVSYQLQNTPTTKPVWSMSGDQGSIWKQATVNIKNTPESFHVSAYHEKNLSQWGFSLRIVI